MRTEGVVKIKRSVLILLCFLNVYKQFRKRCTVLNVYYCVKF